MTTIERAMPVEFRMAGGTLTGTAIRYREEAQDRPEMFLPGAFVTGLDAAALNLQHDSQHIIAEQPDALTLDDGAHSLRLSAMLRPRSAEATLVRRGALTGLSVGFVALGQRQENGVRVIDRAHLDHIALVDSGSYRSKVEIRQQMEKAWLRATVPYGQRMECTCMGGACDSVYFERGSLIVNPRTLVIGGQGFASVLGQVKRGTAIIEDGRKGMRIGLTNPNLRSARQVMEAAVVADMFVRPIIDIDESEYRDDGPTRMFTAAAVSAFLVKATNRSKGIPPAEIDGVEPRRRRRRLWL